MRWHATGSMWGRVYVKPHDTFPGLLSGLQICEKRGEVALAALLRFERLIEPLFARVFFGKFFGKFRLPVWRNIALVWRNIMDLRP